MRTVAPALVTIFQVGESSITQYSPFLRLPLGNKSDDNRAIANSDAVLMRHAVWKTRPSEVLAQTHLRSKPASTMPVKFVETSQLAVPDARGRSIE